MQVRCSITISRSVKFKHGGCINSMQIEADTGQEIQEIGLARKEASGGSIPPREEEARTQENSG